MGAERAVERSHEKPAGGGGRAEREIVSAQGEERRAQSLGITQFEDEFTRIDQ